MSGAASDSFSLISVLQFGQTIVGSLIQKDPAIFRRFKPTLDFEGNELFELAPASVHRNAIVDIWPTVVAFCRAHSNLANASGTRSLNLSAAMFSTNATMSSGSMVIIPPTPLGSGAILMWPPSRELVLGGLFLFNSNFLRTKQAHRS
jgi:hypothetical protein